MRLYKRDRVANVAKTPIVRAALDAVLARRETRSEAAQRAVATRRNNTVNLAHSVLSGELDTVLDGWTWPKLVKAACASYNRGDGIPSWAYGKRDWADRLHDATPDSDPEFVLRITSNFVRHQLVNYEGLLDRLGGLTGKQDAREEVQDLVYDAVSRILSEHKVTHATRPT